jgi:spoIIIJ-associated protein
MKSIEIKAKTLDEAIELASQELNTLKNEIEIEILEEKKSKFFILGDNYIKIKATLKNKEFLDEKPKEFFQKDLQFIDKVTKETTKILKEILEKMHLDLSVTSEFKDGIIFLNINGADAKFIIGKFGETLESLEEILTLIIAKKEKERIRIEIDVDNYKKERDEKLENILKSIADEILKTGISKKMRKLSRKERRKVHLFFEKYPNIETRSFGEGDDRYILITKLENFK